ncbi:MULTISPECIES: hypothetical protein [unclassified Rhizobium]
MGDVLRQIIALVVLVTSMMAAEFAAIAEEDDRATRDANTTLEDNSCEVVNRAYDKMVNTGRWSTDSFWLYPNGNTVLFLHTVYFDRRRFSQRDGQGWLNHERLVRSSIDPSRNTSVFRACEFHGVETVRGEPAFFFTADWQREKETASIEIWISKASGRFVENILHYRPKLAWSDVSDVWQTMDYDRAHAVDPTGFPQNLGPASIIVGEEAFPSH